MKNGMIWLLIIVNYVVASLIILLVITDVYGRDNNRLWSENVDSFYANGMLISTVVLLYCSSILIQLRK